MEHNQAQQQRADDNSNPHTIGSTFIPRRASAGEGDARMRITTMVQRIIQEDEGNARQRSAIVILLNAMPRELTADQQWAIDVVATRFLASFQ